MKKIMLLATVLVLALSVSAQESHSVRAEAIAQHANAGGNGITSTQPAQAVNASAKAPLSGDAQGPPVQKVGSSAITIYDNAQAYLHRSLCMTVRFCLQP